MCTQLFWGCWFEAFPQALLCAKGCAGQVRMQAASASAPRPELRECLRVVGKINSPGGDGDEELGVQGLSWVQAPPRQGFWSLRGKILPPACCGGILAHKQPGPLLLLVVMRCPSHGGKADLGCTPPISSCFLLILFLNPLKKKKKGILFGLVTLVGGRLNGPKQ